MTWVHAVIDVPGEQLERAAEFWGAVFGWPAGEPWPGHPELRSFEPRSGRPYLHLQQIDGPARVHLDVESQAPDETVARAEALGAELVARSDRWQTLRSPGGLPFCVIEAGDDNAPEPLALADGHLARMVQVCVDSPRSLHDREVVFWRELLGGRWAPSPDAEFAGKWHDDAGSPIQLLFQQLDSDEGPVRVHFDHGTDDVSAEVRRLIDLGAEDVESFEDGRGWHVLRDRAGLPFCVTGNSPEQTRRRDFR